MVDRLRLLQALGDVIQRGNQFGELALKEHLPHLRLVKVHIRLSSLELSRSRIWFSSALQLGVYCSRKGRSRS